METTFGECIDNEKKETVVSDCSEMRTEGTSRPSVGLVGTARDGHLPVSNPGVSILNTLTSMQGLYRVFGSVPVSRLPSTIKGPFKALRY